MKSFHKVISAFSMAAILASANAAEIKIGVIMPITGAVAAYGQTAWAGIEIANKISPTLKNGDTIKLVLIDNKGDKVETANAATRLITEDKVSALIGYSKYPTSLTNSRRKKSASSSPSSHGR